MAVRWINTKYMFDTDVEVKIVWRGKNRKGRKTPLELLEKTKQTIPY